MDEKQPIQTLMVECPYWVKVQQRMARGPVGSIFGDSGYIESPQQHFPLVITMQPDGTVITRAFCHKGHEYCKGCSYEQGEWVDRPEGWSME